MIKVGRWANEHKHAAAAILDKQTFYRDVEDTYEGIRLIDMVPNLSPQNLVSVEIGKDFMLSHGYIKNNFDVHEWAAPEFLEQAARELLEEEWKKRTNSQTSSCSRSSATSSGRVRMTFTGSDQRHYSIFESAGSESDYEVLRILPTTKPHSFKFTCITSVVRGFASPSL
ncbi:MAG: hypothetical protein MZV63_49750 [Marinilabiliales bacterium]|nr:hypothetical protein [Marinilabiliales bacterium]